jgi:hypothetical protein
MSTGVIKHIKLLLDGKGVLLSLLAKLRLSLTLAYAEHIYLPTFTVFSG